MGKREIETILDIAKQYLNPKYNTKKDAEPQKQNEEGVIKQVVATLAKKDQDVLTIWNIIKKHRPK